MANTTKVLTLDANGAGTQSVPGGCRLAGIFGGGTGGTATWSSAGSSGQCQLYTAGNEPVVHDKIVINGGGSLGECTIILHTMP